MKTILNFLSLAFLALSLNVFAAGTTLSGQVYLKNANLLPDANTVGSLTKAQILNRTRYLALPVTDFRLSASGAAIATSAADPEVNIINNSMVIEWEQGESASVQTAFLVPADYVSGATISCLVKLDAASTDTTLDFDVYVQASGSAPDSAATNQTPVAVANSTTNLQTVSLAVATDTFSAGNWVTLNINRAAGTGAGSDVNLFGCYLSYTADM